METVGPAVGIVELDRGKGAVGEPVPNVVWAVGLPLGPLDSVRESEVSGGYPVSVCEAPVGPMVAPVELDIGNGGDSNAVEEMLKPLLAVGPPIFELVGSVTTGLENTDPGVVEPTGPVSTEGEPEMPLGPAGPTVCETG